MKNKSKILLIFVPIIIVFGLAFYVVSINSNNNKNKTESNLTNITKQEAIILLKSNYGEENLIFEFKEENEKYYIIKVVNSKFKQEEYWVRKDGSDIEQHVIIQD